MPQTVEQLAADLKWGAERLTSSRYTEDYRTYREYYDGVQNLAFATPKFNATFGRLFSEFSYNRCNVVVDSIADRLSLTGFDVSMGDTTGVTAPTTGPDTETEKTPEELAVEAMWRANRMDHRQGEATTEALLTGDAYAIVWPEQDEIYGGMVAKVYINDANLCAIRYDDDTKARLFGIKAWKLDSGQWRVNLYYPDNIYKYITPEKKDDLPKELGQLTQWVVDENMVAMGLAVAEPWPLPNPFNEIPIFHLANNSREGAYGRSELKDVIPLQDALNKSCTDMMVAAEFGAYPQRWAVGLQTGMPDPLTGKIKSPFKAGPGEVWTAPNQGSFGSFEVANLTQFIAIQDSFDQKISNVARIPSYWLNAGNSGNPPSGESLKTTEGPFVAKLNDRITDEGQFFTDVFTLGLKQMAFVGAILTPLWKSPELRSEQDMLDAAAKKKALGWSQEKIWRELGLDETEIQRMKEENQAAVEEQQARMSAGGGLIPNGGGNTPPNQGQLESGSSVIKSINDRRSAASA